MKIEQDTKECQHTNVIEIGDQKDGYPGGDIQRVKCLDCGLEWNVELPQ